MLRANRDAAPTTEVLPDELKLEEDSDDEQPSVAREKSDRIAALKVSHSAVYPTGSLQKILNTRA